MLILHPQAELLPGLWTADGVRISVPRRARAERPGFEARALGSMAGYRAFLAVRLCEGDTWNLSPGSAVCPTAAPDGTNRHLDNHVAWRYKGACRSRLEDKGSQMSQRYYDLEVPNSERLVRWVQPPQIA